LTVKGKKNHYNVKLLRGYGVSINLKDHRVILKDGMNDISGKSESEEWFITQIPYRKKARYLQGTHGREFIITKEKANQMLSVTEKIIAYTNNFLATIDLHAKPKNGHYIGIGKIPESDKNFG